MPCAESARCLAEESPTSTGLGPCGNCACGPSPVPPSACWRGGGPPPGLACLALGEKAALPGGPPLLPVYDCAPWARAVCTPPLLLVRGLRARLGRGQSVPSACPRAVCARRLGWGGGARPGPEPLLTGGSGGLCWGAPPRAAAARLWRALLVRGFPSPFLPSTAACVKRGLPFGWAPCCRPPLGPLCAVRALGPPFQVRWPPSWGVPAPVLSVIPPLALAGRHGCAPLDGGAPSSFPPSSAARIKRSRPFGGGPLCRRFVGRAPRRALFPRGVVPPFCLLGCAIPPSPAARVRRLRPVWGGPLRHCLIGRSPRRALAPRVVFPPCCLLD